MIGSQQKNKVEKKVKLAVVNDQKLTKEIKLTINPELNKFSADEFLPEKHVEAERRLANSVLPD